MAFNHYRKKSIRKGLSKKMGITHVGLDEVTKTFSRGLTSDFLYFRIEVGNKMANNWNAKSPPYLNTQVLPTQIG